MSQITLFYDPTYFTKYPVLPVRAFTSSSLTLYSPISFHCTMHSLVYEDSAYKLGFVSYWLTVDWCPAIHACDESYVHLTCASVKDELTDAVYVASEVC